MSREKHLKRLKSSLEDTQEILAQLAAGTGKDASKRFQKANKKLQNTWDGASDELEALLGETSKDLRKQYDRTSREVQDQYEKSRKEFGEKASKAKYEIEDRFDGSRAAAKAATAGLGMKAAAFAAKTGLAAKAAKGATNAAGFVAKAGLAAKAAKGATNAAGFLAKTGLAAKAVSMLASTDIKSRTANLLEGAANSFAAARNRLNPEDRLILQHESDQRSRVSKAGYFVRFSALAIIIISKRHQLMELGTKLYDKLKDSEGRASLTQAAKDQFDTMRRLINAYASGQYREFPYRSLVKIVAGVIYFVSVADLIPDFIPILGLTDDIAIIAWIYASVKDDLQQFVDWEAAEEKRRSRLAKQSTGNTTSTSGSSGSDSTTGSGVANVGNAAAPDRKASPAVTETGNKATVTTGTSGTSGTSSNASSSGLKPGASDRPITGGSSNTGNNNL